MNCCSSWLLVALGCLLPATAGAQVYLGWNDTGPQMRMLRQFDCASNDGVDTLVASFDAPAGVTKLVELEAVIDFCTGQEGLPDWWRFDGCRSGAVSATTVMGPVQYAFADYWQGRGEVTVQFSPLSANTGRLVVNIKLDPEEAGPLTAGTNYYAFCMFFDHRLTVGPGSCSGCDRSACFRLNDVRLIWPEGETRLHGNNAVAWQRDVIGCSFVVPVVPVTWSSIKTLLD